MAVTQPPLVKRPGPTPAEDVVFPRLGGVWVDASPEKGFGVPLSVACKVFMVCHGVPIGADHETLRTFRRWSAGGDLNSRKRGCNPP